MLGIFWDASDGACIIQCSTDVIVDIKRQVRWAGQSENMVQITNAHIFAGKSK
jgi:hypothetical protein